MSDIVDRLRLQHREGLAFMPPGHQYVSYGDAADEIERLHREIARLREHEKRGRGDWFWRQLDPEECGDSIHEALRFVGQGVVCHVGASWSAGSFFAAIVPAADIDSDETDEVVADTEEECLRLVLERYAARAALASARSEKAGADRD